MYDFVVGMNWKEIQILHSTSKMETHPHRQFGRTRPYSTYWSTSLRSAELRLLVSCLCLHALFCTVHVSALPSQNGSTSLDCRKTFTFNGTTQEGSQSNGTRSCFQNTKTSLGMTVPAQKSVNREVLIATIVSAVVAMSVIAAVVLYCYFQMRQRKQAANDQKLRPREQTMLSFVDARGSTGSSKSTPTNPPNVQTGNVSNSGQEGRWTFSSGVTNSTVVINEVSTDGSTISLRAADVKRATRNFGKKIGEGGFGPVYYGKLPDSHIEVAVKVQAKGSHQGAREFATEVEILSRAKHPNLVSLVGYSEEDGGYMLVYEFLSGGTLQERLYGNRCIPPLEWDVRLKIAVQSAKGLEYLHNECVPSIIHRDVKSNNILLTNLADAKVTDFGLSKFLEGDACHISKCSIKGTSGYLDPEYFETQKLTQKSDVYSFGIVLLELVSGCEPLDTNRDRDEWRIADWARNRLIAGEIEKVADTALEGRYNTQSLWTVAELAMTCVEPRSVHRPKISEVVLELETAVREEANGATVALLVTLVLLQVALGLLVRSSDPPD